MMYLKENETILQEHEFLFRAQFNLGNIGIAITSLEKGWLRVNPKLCQMLGYSEQELMQRTWAEMTYPQDLEPDLIQFQRMLAGEIDKYELEKRFIRKDGSLVYTHLTVACYRDNGKIQFVIAGLLDITERKQAEADLKASEERFRILFNQAPIGIALIDSLTGQIYKANPKFAEIVGLTVDELQTIDWMKLTHPDDIQADLNNMALMNAGKTNGFVMEKRYIHANGSIVWVNLTVAKIPIHEHGHPCHHCIVEDITERKRAEEALRESQTMLAATLQALPDLLFEVDGEGRFYDFRAPNREELFIHPEFFLGKTIHQVLPPDSAQIIAQAIAETVATGRHIGAVYSLPMPDGLTWFELSITTKSKEEKRFIVLARNITKRKQAENALRQAYADLQEAQRIAHLGSWYMDVATNKVTCSEQLYLMLGLDPNLPMPDYNEHKNLFTLESWQRLTTAIARTIESGTPYTLELEMVNPDGKHGWMLARGETVLDTNGAVVALQGIALDISERKKLEENIKHLSESELNKAKLEAEKASRAKSEFLSSMSHELRTPMNAVLGFTQLLEMEDLTEGQMENVQEILTAGRHLLDLINEVLDLAKIEADKIDLSLEKLNVKTEIKNCLTLMQPLSVKNNITIFENFCINCNDLLVMADKFRLKQVLLNLISNAIKYNRPNGSVTLSCVPINQQTLKVSVIDTGNGLSEAEQAKLFQPFERLSAKNSALEGSGIGLVISKKLIEAMNGRIGVESTKGKGSCFWIEIPLGQNK